LLLVTVVSLAAHVLLAAMHHVMGLSPQDTKRS
jgi:hypothetical protein